MDNQLPWLSFLPPNKEMTDCNSCLYCIVTESGDVNSTIQKLNFTSELMLTLICCPKLNLDSNRQSDRHRDLERSDNIGDQEE